MDKITDKEVRNLQALRVWHEGLKSIPKFAKKYFDLGYVKYWPTGKSYIILDPNLNQVWCITKKFYDEQSLEVR